MVLPLPSIITNPSVGLSGYVGVDRRVTSFRVHSVVTDQQDAFSVAEGSTSRLHDQNFDPAITPASISHDSHLTYRYTTLATLQFIFEAYEGSILTEEKLAEVRNIEQRFLNATGYTDRCLLEFKDYRTLPTGYYPLPTNEQRVQCLPPLSATNFFYPTLNASESRKYAMYDIYDLNGNGTHLYHVPDVTNMMAQGGAYAWFVSRNFSVWNQTSSVLRTQFSFGAPVAPDTDLTNLDEQKEAFASWITSFSSEFESWGTDNVRLLWQGTSITSWEITQLIKRDSLFCIGSVLLVLVWMIFHFRSVTLALVGMLNLLACIPVGHFVTHIIMGNKYLGLLMTLPIFIIAGIGCDDIFVFFDAWRASGTQGSHISSQVETRLDWTYRRAVSSMLVTSLTSSATFFITAISPIPPIRQFGIAMGANILANFLLATTFFPAALLLWHRYLEHRFTWGNSLSALMEMCLKPSDEDAAAQAAAAKARSDGQLYNPTSIIVSMDDVSIVQDVKDGEDLMPQPLPELELDKYPYLSKRKRVRHDSGGESSAATSSDEGPRMSTDGNESEDEGAVRVVSHTQTGVKMIIELDEEPLADPWKLNAAGRYFYFTYVPFVYAIRWIVLLIGIILLVLCFAAAFKLEPHRGIQNFFPVGSNLNDFDELVDNVFNLDDSSYSEINLVWGITGIDRSNIDLNDPVAIGSTVYDTSFNLSMATTQEWIVTVFEDARTARIGGEGTAFIANANMQLHKSFMSAFKSFRTGRGESFPVMDSAEFWTVFRAWLRSEDGDSYADQLGWTTELDSNDQTLLWCSVSLRSAIVPTTASASALYSFQESWTNFMSTKDLSAPEGANKGFATSTDFIWVLNMKALVKQAGWGTFGAILVAFAVLILVTWNILVSIYAILSIGMVVMLVVGFFAIAGWDLGIMEFVSLTVVVGISIGFTVHISMAYLMYARHSMLKDKPRVAIVQYAMAELGSPLIGGAITTATSVIMLFFCKITLFSHFGKFLFINTIASLLTAFFLLVAILMVIGPRGDFGSLQGIVAWHKERQRKSREKKRLKERLAKAKHSSAEQFKENNNYEDSNASYAANVAVSGMASSSANGGYSSGVEMTPVKSPSRHLDRSVHRLAPNSSTSSLSGLAALAEAGEGVLHTSVSMSDFELNLDDDENDSDVNYRDGVPHFDLDASLSAQNSRRDAFDVPDEDEDDDDDNFRLTPVKPKGLPKPQYDDDDDE